METRRSKCEATVGARKRLRGKTATKHYEGSVLNLKLWRSSEIKKFFFFFPLLFFPAGGWVGVDEFTKLLFSASVLSLAWKPAKILPQSPLPKMYQAAFALFMSSHFPFFSSSSSLSYFPQHGN